VSACDFGDNGKAESRAGMARPTASPKAFKHMRPVAGRDAGALIRHADRAHRIDCNDDFRSAWCVGDRVFDQVAQGIRHGVSITTHSHRTVIRSLKTERPPLLYSPGREILHARCRYSAQIDDLVGIEGSGIQPRDPQELLDQTIDAGRIIAELGELRIVFEAFEARAQDSQRRSELMCRVRCELPLCRESLLEAVQSTVDGRGQGG
jgi:hypothetical protein